MRSIWKGSISFGLVNIPISLYSATSERELKFVMLHKSDMSEIRYARICKAEGKEIPYEDIVKGYEFEKGSFVVLSDEDFKKANIEKSKAIEIVSFANEDEIDSIYFERPYFLEPDKKADKAYALLRDALKKSKKVGVVRYVFRNHERLGIVKGYDAVLVLIQMRMSTELLSAKPLKLPKASASMKEVKMALELIDKRTERFNPKKYHDTYVDDLKKIIKQKAKGKKIVPKGEPVGIKSRSTKVYDIVSLLKKSLETPKTKKLRKTA